jgi:hypothetical protein
MYFEGAACFDKNFSNVQVKNTLRNTDFVVSTTEKIIYNNHYFFNIKVTRFSFRQGVCRVYLRTKYLAIGIFQYKPMGEESPL